MLTPKPTRAHRRLATAAEIAALHTLDAPTERLPRHALPAHAEPDPWRWVKSTVGTVCDSMTSAALVSAAILLVLLLVSIPGPVR